MRKTVGFGAHRLKLDHPGATREERLKRSSEMLCRALNLRTTVAVVGAGFSVSRGYPTWRELALETVALTVEHLPDRSGHFELRRLLSFKSRLQSDEIPGPKELMFYIGICKRLLSNLSRESDPFNLYLEERFKLPERETESEFDPFRALLELKISRFVTTNYDCEIERALSERHRIPLIKFGIGDHHGKPSSLRLLSFTQRAENQDQLALFALGRVEAARNMVFHCHGRYDDPESIIAGEADYQRWYLAGEAEDGTAFLQTIKLLFNSNPILFVGYSLGDEDLLRQLRLISAVHPEQKDARPLFALLPEASDGADSDYHEQLYERYGVHVLPFEAPSDPSDWGRVYCRQLERLRRIWHDWREGWLQKPLIRSVEVDVRPPRTYRHYDLDTRGQETLGRKRIEEKLAELEDAALAKARIIALVGPGGTGKSYHALKLLNRMRGRSDEIQGLFFWSSYYADDSLTGLDRLLAYLDPDGDRRASRFKRLRASIHQGRYVVVFDGFERLLREGETPDQGKSHDPAVKELLKAFSEPENHSTIILTSRLWPSDLKEDKRWVRRIGLLRMRTEDIRDVEPFSWFLEAELSALCSLLEGHTYGLALAARYLARDGRSQAPERLADLRRRLADTPPDRRVSRMIRVAIRAIDDETDGLALAFLERLAVFMSPVTEQTIRLCFQLAERSLKRNPSSLPSLDEFVEILVRSRLFFRVRSGPDGAGPNSYTVHPTVRSYVFREVHRAERDALPNFTLAGFTSGTAAVHPGSRENSRKVRQLFDSLENAAWKAVEDERLDEARQFCRSLFGIMRSRMETNTVARWCTYPDYIRFGIRLANLAKEVSPGLWSFRERHEIEKVEHPQAPLYADELAFLYNDIGLTLCCEGYMLDTSAVWEQGYEINRVLEGSATVPQYTLQSQLHLGHTYIEIGNLQIADQYLYESEKTNYQVQDLDYEGRIDGYKGLITHLRGHLAEAGRIYEEALRKLKEAGGNPRAESFFFRHRASLAITLGDLDSAEEYVRSSLALAEVGEYKDLVAYSRLTRGGFLRAQESYPRATAEYQAALQMARRFGIRRLESEALLELARLAIDLGDAYLARRRALDALAIANEIGLGLRQTHGMVVLGLANIQAGHARLGTACLKHAWELANQQQYWLRGHEAEEKLQEIGEWADPSGLGAVR